MSEYYDKDKFSGGKPPARPPSPKKQDDWEWLRWPAIILLFVMGLWPVAVFLIVYFSKQEKKANAAKQQRNTEERVARALERAEARVAQARERTTQESAAKTLEQAQERIAQARARAHTAAQQNAAARPAAQQVPQGKKSAPAAQTKKAGKSTGKALRIIGICLLVMGAILCIDSVPSLLEGYTYSLETLVSGLGFLAGGGISLGRGQYLANMSRRTQRYILAIGAAESMRMDEIAKRVNRTPKQAAKELQKLIDKGYLGEDAYIDHQKGYFLRFGATIEEVREVEVPPETAEGYSGILRNLRTANDRIPDAVLSEKIERLEQISALIFKEVEAHPEKRERIHTFFDYYLPTTQKLLDTYAEFDEMGVEGENLTQAKERIEAMMDSIVEGFEHQLDQLYSADAMDVVSDINVMKTMLSRDTASAAKDFGYDTAKNSAAKDEHKPQQMEF